MRKWVGLALLAWSAAAGSAAAAWLDEVGVELEFDDNVPRGQLARDVKHDTLLRASVSGGPRFQLTGSDSLALSATLTGAAYARYQGLDNTSAGLGLTYRHKFGLGPYVPQLAVTASAAHLDYRDTLRDGWLYALQAEASERLSARWTLRASLRGERRDADRVPDRLLPFMRANVFDLTSRSAAVLADFAFDPRYLLSFGYAVHHGDIVSTTLRNLPVFLASSAIARDRVFGDDTFAYRMPALTRAVQLRVSRFVGSQGSVSLAYEYRDSRAHGGIDYQSNLVRATYLYGF